jgi:hypothetical protein
MRTVGFRHLGWDMSHRGVIFKMPEVRALSELKAYEHLPHDEAGSKHWQELDQRADLACGAPWSAHLEATDTWT